MNHDRFFFPSFSVIVTGFAVVVQLRLHKTRRVAGRRPGFTKIVNTTSIKMKHVLGKRGIPFWRLVLTGKPAAFKDGREFILQHDLVCRSVLDVLLLLAPQEKTPTYRAAASSR